jgi:hypothetical protein
MPQPVLITNNQKSEMIEEWNHLGNLTTQRFMVSPNELLEASGTTGEDANRDSNFVDIIPLLARQTEPR